MRSVIHMLHYSKVSVKTICNQLLKHVTKHYKLRSFNLSCQSSKKINKVSCKICLVTKVHLFSNCDVAVILLTETTLIDT